VNTKATIYLPANKSSVITVNNLPVKQIKGIKLKKFENGKAVIELGSGMYQLKVQ